MNKIYPILKPGDWVGIDSGCIYQTLFGTDEIPDLVTAFGYDTPDSFVFISPEDLGDKDPEIMISEAYENLEKLDLDFEIASPLEGKILSVSEHDFCSEKILCKNFMLKAHQILKSEELFASIPRRRCMMVISSDADSNLLTAFIDLHTNVWEDTSSNAPILNALFVITEGEISGIIPWDKL